MENPYVTMQTRVKPSRTFSDALLDDFRQKGDAPADAVIAAVLEASGQAGLRALMQWLADPADLSTNDQQPSVQHFFAEHTQLPAWADATMMQKGMTFFQKHDQQIGLTLGLFSLPFSYLGAKGAQVLWLTERIRNDTMRRLQETGEWVFAVNKPNEWETGNAIRRILKVRLIHAGARWFALQSSRWQIEWGRPVNQEDMAGTNLTFSYVVLLGLRKIGISASEQEEEAYLHHINVVNYLNGVDGRLLPQNLREAFTLAQAISRRQFASSEAGIGLTRSLLNAFVQQIDPTRPETTRNLVAGEMRFFLGDRYADWLGIPSATAEKRLAGLLTRLPLFPKQLSSS